MVRKIFPIALEGLEAMSGDELTEELIRRAKAAYENKEKEIGVDFLRHLERIILLDVVDSKWKDHLRNMDNLREGIGLRAYGQKDPLVEYKREAFEAFQEMIHVIKEDTLEFIFRVQPAIRASADFQPANKASAPARPVGGGLRPEEKIPLKKTPALQFVHPDAASTLKNDPPVNVRSVSPAGAGEFIPATAPEDWRPQTARNTGEKVGRNEPCPCGSGKKYKKCHGR